MSGSMLDAWWSVLPPCAAVWLAGQGVAAVPALRTLVLVVVGGAERRSDLAVYAARTPMLVPRPPRSR